jgi:hypothetical protein
MADPMAMRRISQGGIPIRGLSFRFKKHDHWDQQKTKSPLRLSIVPSRSEGKIWAVLSLCTTWWWVDSFTILPLYSRRKSLLYALEGPQSRYGQINDKGDKSRRPPVGNRTPAGHRHPSLHVDPVLPHYWPCRSAAKRTNSRSLRNVTTSCWVSKFWVATQMSEHVRVLTYETRCKTDQLDINKNPNT